jgi:hypothetical protein
MTPATDDLTKHELATSELDAISAGLQIQGGISGWHPIPPRLPVPSEPAHWQLPLHPLNHLKS